MEMFFTIEIPLNRLKWANSIVYASIQNALYQEDEETSLIWKVVHYILEGSWRLKAPINITRLSSSTNLIDIKNGRPWQTTDDSVNSRLGSFFHKRSYRSGTLYSLWNRTQIYRPIYNSVADATRRYDKWTTAPFQSMVVILQTATSYETAETCKTQRRKNISLPLCVPWNWETRYFITSRFNLSVSDLGHCQSEN